MMDSGNSSTEAVVGTVATSTMKGGNVATVIGWMASNEAIALIGILITICGFIVNLYFQWKRDRREQELQRAKLRELAATPEA